MNSVPATMRAVLLTEHGGMDKLSEFHKAQTDFMAKKFIGKLVVVPDAKWDLLGAQRYVRPT
jgi:hypothetical protein